MSNTIFLSGASGNLGGVVRNKLIGAGYKVLAPVRDAEEARSLASNNLETYPVDLLNEARVADMFDKVREKHPLRAAVLLAGGFSMGDLLNTDPEEIQQMIRLNFLTAFIPVRHLLRLFEKQGGGRLFLTGARPALDPVAGKGMVAYSLSKSLLFRLAEQVNEFGRDKNITAHVLVPSIIDTPPNRKAMPKADPADWVSPEAIADTLLFLLGESGREVRESVIKLYNNA